MRASNYKWFVQNAQDKNFNNGLENV